MSDGWVVVNSFPANEFWGRISPTGLPLIGPLGYKLIDTVNTTKNIIIVTSVDFCVVAVVALLPPPAAFIRLYIRLSFAANSVDCCVPLLSAAATTASMATILHDGGEMSPRAIVGSLVSSLGGDGDH
eukprot:scaffold4428_cov57-Cyclotella_meneghiniana.AAC.8